MGCDIHAYVEYKKKDSDIKKWSNFGEQFRLDRIYAMFGLLSKGVRAEYEDSFETKGLPDNLGWRTEMDNRLLISETGAEDGCCTLGKAESWVKHGCVIQYGKDGKPIYVSHPDHHSHSWLTVSELQKVMESFYKLGDYYPIDYCALLKAMEHFEEKGFDCRLVFWFDN